MLKRCRTTQRVLLATAVLLTAIQTACSSLLPDGVRSGMGGGTRINRDESSWSESMLYRIDNHRWITTRGITPCEGRMYYHDSKLGIDTFVGDTGVSGSHTGPFHGYYAIDSSYIAIPATKESSFSGAQRVKMYYSTDEGRTFRYFWTRGTGYADEFVILKGSVLYLGQFDDSKRTKIYEADRIDLEHGVPLKYGDLDWNVTRKFYFVEIPISMRSPFGATEMCQ